LLTILIEKYKLKSYEDFFSFSVCSGVKISNFYSSGHDSIRLLQMIECKDLKEEKMRLESQEKKFTELVSPNDTWGRGSKIGQKSIHVLFEWPLITYVLFL